MIQAALLYKQGVEKETDNSSDIKSPDIPSAFSELNNRTFLLPVFSFNESDFEEEEKQSQIWPRSRLPSSFTSDILSDKIENLHSRSKTATKIIKDDESLNTLNTSIERASNNKISTTQESNTLLRDDSFEEQNEEGM